MARLPHYLAVFVLAAVHLLLFSICPISGRIYQTKDAVVIEVDDVRPSNFANRHFVNPPPIPVSYAVNPFTGPYYKQQIIIPVWPYPPANQPKPPCGAGPTSPPQRDGDRIVGGTEAKPNSWPFVVGLRISAAQYLLCGGSIISNTKILTAAHCVVDFSAYDISTMTVSLGIHNQTANDQQQTRRVTRVVYHKDFSKKTWQNDIAILTVEPPINYSKDISPVCLPEFDNAADLYAGKDATFMGWGRTTFANTKIPDTLQQVTIPIVTQAVCSAAYASAISIVNQHICAGADKKDTCQGDSGGPVVLQTNADFTAWTQIAIVSFGKNCPASSTMPSVYASVAFFRYWIDTYTES